MVEDLANKIYEERLLIGIEMVKKVAKEQGLKLTDNEVADLGVRIASSLFIEKNKAYRTSQIRR